ncbi:dihydropyrimidinase [Faecalicatena orotica]|uniref:Dihydropyrimidinase n=1 Tax=Faecalicatena orotica TaxID=1544 RepID=A0A2Y9BA08_9FIRM|nr:dihydropyrimidinase [Faecalicatena orotica]PWJ32441.1 dihydropyrimidinase [Faecalicatena orotica]SSA54276.1 dihydropyrimidinase [Faecalicatena orotica]
MKRLFKGGTIVSGEGMKQLDILVKGEKILAVGEDLEFRDAEIEDVRGKYLFPGFIDAHTHMALEVSGTITADKFDTGTKAEIAGGTTCIVDFATQNKGESLKEALDNWHKKADGESSCDYAFHLAISDWNEKVSEELAQVVADGIPSFKLYMTYDNMIVDDKTMYEILTRLKELGGIAGVHCENNGIIAARLNEVLQEKGNRLDTADYPGTRPPAAEAEAINRLLKIAKCVDTPVIVVHLSSAEGYREIQHAREDGQTVYVETCPQYLLMDESKYFLPDGEGRKYMIAPPLRKKKNQQVLWEALSEGRIQTICTDHCSFDTAQKNMGAEDFSKTPCGMPGGEERPALIYQFGVNEGRITLEQMCKYLSENPAKLYRMYPQKGTLSPGSDADIVVWNPETEWTISKEHQQTNIDYCPMEGTTIKGRAEKVFLRGQLAAENGEIIAEKTGQYVPRGIS